MVISLKAEGRTSAREAIRSSLVLEMETGEQHVQKERFFFRMSYFIR